MFETQNLWKAASVMNPHSVHGVFSAWSVRMHTCKCAPIFFLQSSSVRRILPKAQQHKLHIKPDLNGHQHHEVQRCQHFQQKACSRALALICTTKE